MTWLPLSRIPSDRLNYSTAHHFRLLTVCCAAILASAWILLMRQPRLASHAPQQALILFKLPRSGSTWITEQLNSHGAIFLSKEIIQKKDIGRFTSSEIENHLISALSSPTGKLSSKSRWFPDGRFAHDFFFRKSFAMLRGSAAALRVIGFTVNPEHCGSLNWDRIIAAVPQVKVLKLVRTNIVKAAISGRRGQQMHSLCGVSNLPATGASARKCSAAAVGKLNWTVAEFKAEVAKWQVRYAGFDSFFRDTPALSRLTATSWSTADSAAVATSAVAASAAVATSAVATITYEEVQVDSDAAFRRAFQSLGLLDLFGKPTAIRPKNGNRQDEITPAPALAPALEGDTSIGGRGSLGSQQADSAGSASASAPVSATTSTSTATTSASTYGWTKRTKEDLSEVLSRFHEIDAALAAAGPACDCIRGQLRATQPRPSIAAAAAAAAAATSQCGKGSYSLCLNRIT